MIRKMLFLIVKMTPVMIGMYFYWIGPYGCYIPYELDECIAEDGYNIKNKDGSETERYIENPLTHEDWLKLHAYSKNGVYFYITKKPAIETKSICCSIM